MDGKTTWSTIILGILAVLIILLMAGYVLALSGIIYIEGISPQPDFVPAEGDDDTPPPLPDYAAVWRRV